MSRYIDKDKLLERLKTRSVKGDCKFCIHFEECAKINSRKGSHLNCWEMIDMPEADVVEVKRGKNITNMYHCDEFICSQCGLIMRDLTEVRIDEDNDDECYYEFEFKYCPECGAKMDGDINE